MLKALTIVYREGLVEGTLYRTVLRLLAASRVLLFPHGVLQFHSTEILKKLCSPTRTHDPLYFLTHNCCISKHFTLRQRVQSAINHHQFELKNYSSEYARQVYRSSGVLLWDNMLTSSLPIVLCHRAPRRRSQRDFIRGYIRLCRMSFCYLDARIFGLTSHKTMLVSRNQTDRNNSRDLFNRCFKQNTPQLFCLSAICGIAMANRIRSDVGDQARCSNSVRRDPRSRAFQFILGIVGEFRRRRVRPARLQIERAAETASITTREPRPPGPRPRSAPAWDEIVQSPRSRMIDYRMVFPSPGRASEVARAQGQFA